MFHLVPAAFSLLLSLRIPGIYAFKAPNYSPDLIAERWKAPSTEKTGAWIDETSHYAFDKDAALALEEFRRLIPATGSTIRVGKDARASGDRKDSEYTVAMLHQLQCLGIIAEDIVKQGTSDRSDHCINYLRQSFLCHANMGIEPIYLPTDHPGVFGAAPSEHECGDWESIYDSVNMS